MLLNIRVLKKKKKKTKHIEQIGHQEKKKKEQIGQNANLLKVHFSYVNQNRKNIKKKENKIEPWVATHPLPN